MPPQSSRHDPFRGFRFQVEITGIIVAAFTEVSVPDITVDPIDYREGTDPSYSRTLSGLTKYAHVTLKKGLTNSMELYNWHFLVVDKGTSVSNARRNATINLLDTDGTIGAQWSIFNAWPTVYQTSGLNAATAEVAIETLELAIETMKRLK